MVDLRLGDQQKAVAPPRGGEVGEVDTRAPIQSVKAAVSLFGDVVKRRKRSPAVRRSLSKLSSEDILGKETDKLGKETDKLETDILGKETDKLGKETQLLLVQRELDKYKQQLETSERTKSKAQEDLEQAKRTLAALTAKFDGVTESKQAAIEASEKVKKRAKELEGTKSQKSLGYDGEAELDEARSQYAIKAAELNAVKQELTWIQQDFDTSLEEKQALFQQAAEAQRSANVNGDRVNELSKEIKAMRESTQQLKFASTQAQEQLAAFEAEKNARTQALKSRKEEVEKNLEALTKEYDPEFTRNLELKLEETNAEIEILQEEMKKAHALELGRMKIMTTELNKVAKELREVSEEESSLRSTVNSLRLEIEAVKNEQDKLEANKAEREAADKVKLEEIEKETKVAVQAALEMKKDVELLKQETEKAKSTTANMHDKLEIALREAEEAKAAEKRVLDEIRTLSESQNVQEIQCKKNIKLLLAEFEGLKKKVEESESLEETKVGEAMAQVEVVNASKDEAAAKLEVNLKSLEEIREATEVALKSAEVDEAAQKLIEAELQKCRGSEEA